MRQIELLFFIGIVNRILCQARNFGSASSEQASSRQVDKHEFKAETRMLLDIVARSLYSENEVFIRELVSNASDALEKFRYTIHTAGEDEKNYENVDRPLEIHLETNKQAQTLTIKDSGIGKILQIRLELQTIKWFCGEQEWQRKIWSAIWEQ